MSQRTYIHSSFLRSPLDISTDDGYDNAAVNPSFTSVIWQGPLRCTPYLTSSMSPLRRFALYYGLAPQYCPVHPASSTPFYQEAPVPFRCPLQQGNSVCGWRQAFPPGLSEPLLPFGHSSSVVHPVSSPTIFTCAPGAVRHQTTAALLAHCLVV